MRREKGRRWGDGATLEKAGSPAFDGVAMFVDENVFVEVRTMLMLVLDDVLVHWLLSADLSGVAC